jgi:hypothetical protein
MSVLLLLVACLELAVVVALRFRFLRSRSVASDETGCEFEDEPNWAANDTPKFPYFG